MSRPTPIVLILVGIGLGPFGLRIFGIGSLQYGWVLALSICLFYVIVKRPNKNRDCKGPIALASVGTAPIFVAMWNNLVS